jgi:hypothetical protein
VFSALPRYSAEHNPHPLEGYGEATLPDVVAKQNLAARAGVQGTGNIGAPVIVIGLMVHGDAHHRSHIRLSGTIEGR